jgi:predicted acyl esterase
MNSRMFLPGIFFVTAVLSTFAQPGGETAVIENDIAVPMRDGVVLHADVLRPAGQGRFPVLVYRTP